MNKNQENTVTIVIESGKCAWGKCVFCGFGKNIGIQPNVEKLKEIFIKKMKKFEDVNIRTLKIFCSGSFLDDNQFPPEFRKYVNDYCSTHGIENLVIETRPEFITSEKLKDFSNVSLCVAIGLEVADDKILRKLNKGITLQDYEDAVNILRENNVRVRTYLLANPPFVENNKNYLHDSVNYALKFSDEVNINNTYPHSKSDLFNYWVEGKWSPLDENQFKKIIDEFGSNPKVTYDFNNFSFVPRFPKHMQKWLKGVGEEYLTHPYYEVWQDYLVRFYKRPKNRKYALFLPCSYRKPYSRSKTHKEILKKLKELPFYSEIHRIVVSTPGVIPCEFDSWYPFNKYDWPEWEETPEIKERIVEVNRERLKSYLKTHKYEKYFNFLKPDSDSGRALRLACRDLNIDIIECVDIDAYERLTQEGVKNPIISKECLKHLTYTLRANISDESHI